LRDLDLVAEYTEKSFRAQDPAYMDKLLESQKDFQKSLAELQRHANPGEEQDEVKRLSRQWDSYNVDLGLLQQSPSQIRNALPLNLQEDLERLYSQTTSVYQSSLRSMSAMVERSRKTADTAVLGLWCATFAALAISILVSLLIVHSISKPLAHLTEGTRAIADGKFSYRLDTTRNDEFSQLARDFNTMTLRLKELEKEIDLQRKPSQPPQ
jgi:methyl-accepting chemotaxis protein